MRRGMERSLSRIHRCKRPAQTELVEEDRVIRQRGVIAHNSTVVPSLPIVRKFIVHVRSGQVPVCERVPIKPDIGKAIILLRPSDMVDQIVPDSFVDCYLDEHVNIHVVQPILERETTLAITSSIENRQRGIV